MFIRIILNQKLDTFKNKSLREKIKLPKLKLKNNKEIE